MINNKPGELSKSFWIRRLKILVSRLNAFNNENYNIEEIEDEVKGRDIDYCISVYTHYQKIYNSYIDKIHEVAEYER